MDIARSRFHASALRPSAQVPQIRLLIQGLTQLLDRLAQHLKRLLQGGEKIQVLRQVHQATPNPGQVAVHPAGTHVAIEGQKTLQLLQGLLRVLLLVCIEAIINHLNHIFACTYSSFIHIQPRGYCLLCGSGDSWEFSRELGRTGYQ